MADMRTAAVLYSSVASHIDQEIGRVIDAIHHGLRAAHQRPRSIIEDDARAGIVRACEPRA